MLNTALLPVGGKGTRMMGFSKIPKLLIELNGKPLIDYTFEKLAKYGIEQIFIISNEGSKEIENQEAWLNFMNPKIDSLQERYSDKIQINMDAFEKIKLTQTDMMVIQRGVPYPIMVPSFPVLTSDNKLNYGKTFN